MSDLSETFSPLSPITSSSSSIFASTDTSSTPIPPPPTQIPTTTNTNTSSSSSSLSQASRRSPRTLSRYTGSLTLPPLTLSGVALVCALAHRSGWSADRIAISVFQILNVAITGADVYHVNHLWWGVHGGGDEFELPGYLEEVEVGVLRSFGICERELGRGRPLWKTEPPTADTIPLFPGYTNELRERSKQFLFVSSSRHFAQLTPAELPLLEHFPAPLSNLIADTLHAWSKCIRKHLRRAPASQKHHPINHHAQVELILQHLEEYTRQYESIYNLMEVWEHCASPDVVAINSTGYGVKVFLGLLMTDRLNVIDMKRRAARERIGFVVLGFGELDNREGEGKCNVCLEEMSPEKEGEVPLRMVVCCGQILGGNCLRQWVNSLAGSRSEPTCPLCRHGLSEAFVDKLFEGYEEERVRVPVYVEEDEDEMDDLDMSLDIFEDEGRGMNGERLPFEALLRPDEDLNLNWRLTPRTGGLQPHTPGDNSMDSPAQHRLGEREDDFSREG